MHVTLLHSLDISEGFYVPSRFVTKQVPPDTFSQEGEVLVNSETVAGMLHRPCMLRVNELLTFRGPECNAIHLCMRGQMVSKSC
jgi:hypothetical protein